MLKWIREPAFWLGRIDTTPNSISGQGRDRTGDTRIFSPVLYQLSYLAKTATEDLCGRNRK